MEVEISNIFLDLLYNYLISLLDIVEKYQAYSLFDFKATAKLKKNIHLTLLKEATYRGLLQSNLSHPSCPIMPFDLLKLLLVVSLHIFLDRCGATSHVTAIPRCFAALIIRI